MPRTASELSQSDLDIITNMHDDGADPAELAEHFDLSETEVRKILGISDPDHDPTRDQGPVATEPTATTTVPAATTPPVVEVTQPQIVIGSSVSVAALLNRIADPRAKPKTAKKAKPTVSKPAKPLTPKAAMQAIRDALVVGATSDLLIGLGAAAGLSGETVLGVASKIATPSERETDGVVVWTLTATERPAPEVRAPRRESLGSPGFAVSRPRFKP